MADLQLQLRLTADGSGLVGTLRTATGELRSFVAVAEGGGAKTEQSVQQAAAAVQQMGSTAAAAAQEVASGMSVAEGAVKRLAETEEQATARIRAMVDASLAAKEAAGGIEQSQRALAERVDGTRERVQAWVQSQEAATNAQDAINERMRMFEEAEARAARSAQAAGDAVAKETADIGKLLGQIDPVVKKLGELDELEDRLRAARKAGQIGGDDYDVYAAKIAKMRGEVVSAADGMHTFSLKSAAARRELGVLVGEVARGDLGALQGSLMTLANRTGLLTGSLASLAISVGVVLGVLGLFAGATISGYREMQAYERIVVATGGAAGVTGSQIAGMAERIGAATGRYADATAALTKLGSTGRLTGEQLELAARGAVAWATMTGESVDKAATEVEKLATRPTEAVLKLNEQYHFLTTRVFEHIAALERAGDAEGATTASLRAFASESERRAQAIVDNAGSIERAWTKVRDAVAGAWLQLKDIGRADIEGRLGAAKRELAELDQVLAQYQRGRNGAGGLDRVAYFVGNVSGGYDRNIARQAALLSEIQGLEKEAAASSAAAAAQGAHQRAQDAATEAMRRQQTALDAHATKQEMLTREIAKTREEFALLRTQGVATMPNGMSIDTAESTRIQQIKDQYKESGAAARKMASDTVAAANALDALSNYADSLAAHVGGPLDQAWQKYNNAITRGNQLAEAALIKGAQQIDVEAQLASVRENATAERDQTIDKIVEETDIVGRLRDQYAAEAQALGLSARAHAQDAAVINAARIARQQVEQKIRTSAALTQEEITSIRELAGAHYDLNKAASDLDEVFSRFGEKTGFEKLADQIQAAEDALNSMHDAAGNALDPKQVEGLQRALGEMRHAMVTGIVDSAQTGLRSLQSMTTEGSDAFRAMQVAIDALTVVQAISAVLNQAQGDPYTAFARMAAMAAAVAQLGVSIGNFGGGGGPSSASAEVRQKAQGTGTVLGDPAAKSESIARATEITANATQQLVGLNRGMLTALQALQSALGAAGNQLARGAGNVDFGAIGGSTRGLLGFDPLGNALTSDPIGSAIGSFLWGGSKKIIDQGIVIAGGTLQSMLDQIVVGAYRTVHKDGGLFGSDKTFDQVVDVSDSFGRQFQLVVRSIVDTVRQGALALGMLPDEVEAAIAAYKVEEIRISLKGLSAEEQQAELQAVFSSIFDGLAGAVVPYIEQFQRIGEGLGETLVRVATEVQVAHEAFRRLGIAVDETDPEKFAQTSDSLIEAAGGLDAFVSGLQSFVEHFAPEGHRLSIAGDELKSALEQVGLSVPATREQMWDLRQSLDATTEEGRKQIATLLRLADVADQYYDGLDESARKLASARSYLESLGITPGLSAFGRRLVEINDSATKAVEAANTLARAQGAEGASAMQVAAIHLWAARQIGAAARELQADIARIKADLYSQVPGSLNLINQRISELESAANSAGAGIDTVREAGENLFESWRSGVKSVQDYLDSMLLGDLSNLTPEQQIDEARRQLLDAQAAAARGDTAALAKLPQLADAFLRLQRDSLASGADWNAEVDWVRQLLGSVAGMQNPYAPPGPGGAANDGSYTITPSAELQALYAARDAAMATEYAEQRRALAQQLVEHLSDYATLLKVPVLELIEAQGFNLRQLATDLGADLQNLTGQSVEVLGNMATTLGVPLGAIVEKLGLSLPDLKDGLAELTKQLGIDLDDLTGKTITQLAALAGSLGSNLGELSKALGIDLGKLTDVDSPIFLALRENISMLSPGIKDELSPYLDAVKNAAGDEEKNLAVKALRDHVDQMAPEIRNQLGPYFDDIMPAKALGQLDFLEEIRDRAVDQLDVLGLIRSNLAAANRDAGITAFAAGGLVTGPTVGLVGEAGRELILPNPVTEFFMRSGVPISVRGGAANDDSRVVAALSRIERRLDSLERSNSAGHARTASTVDGGDKQASQQHAEMMRALRDGSTNRSNRF